MNSNLKWLQLFADGAGAAGDGGASPAAEGGQPGVTPADAGQESYADRLKALGVPEHKIRNRAKPAAQKAEPKVEQAPAAPQVAAAQEPNQEPEAKPQKMTWDEILADPDYNREMQNVVRARLKESKAAQESMEKLNPALELLAARYKVDTTKPEGIEALVKAIQDDDAYYEDRAIELGVDTETAKKIDMMERENARMRAEQERNVEQQKVQQHIQKLAMQAEELKKQFPAFDLRAEMQNPAFVRMTAPDSPVSLEDAYFAVHRKEIQAASMRVAAQTAMEKVSNAVQAGQRRPAESGSAGQAATVSTFDYAHASKEQRDSLKRQIREAAARGQKIYPGGKR